VYILLAMTTLKDFLTNVGDDAAAALIGVTPRAVAAWRRGERFPRPVQADRIVRIAKNHPAGPVDYAGIYKRQEAA